MKIGETEHAVYFAHNSKPAVGKEGQKILRAAKSGKPIANKAATTTIETIVARHNAQKTDAAKTKVR